MTNSKANDNFFLLQKELNRIIFIKNNPTFDKNHFIPYFKNDLYQIKPYIEYITQKNCQYIGGSEHLVYNIIDTDIDKLYVNENERNTIKIETFSNLTVDKILDYCIGFPITKELIIEAYLEKFKFILKEDDYPLISVISNYPGIIYKFNLGYNEIKFLNKRLTKESEEKLFNIFLT